jgi:nucleoside-diphosphate-sugar epimerase
MLIQCSVNEPRAPVVVTGATGFLGRKLVQFLIRTGCVVHAFTRRPRKVAEETSRHVIWHQVPGAVQHAVQLVREIRPQCVYHLAAMFRAVHASPEIDDLIEANMSYGVRLAEAFHATGGGVFVNASTVWQCVKSESYYPACLYAAMKQAQEDVLQHYAVNGTVRVVNVRLADVYGPDDPRPRLLALLKMAAAANASDVELTGGEQLVDLVHVDDVVQGFIKSALAGSELSAGEKSRIFSVSSGRLLKVKELVALVESILDRPLAVRFGARPYRRHEMFEPWKAGLPPPGWWPLIPLEEGLRNIIMQEQW